MNDFLNSNVYFAIVIAMVFVSSYAFYLLITTT